MTKGNVTSWSSKKGGEKRKWQLLKKGQIKMLQAAVKFSYPGPLKYIIALQNLDFCTLVWSCYLVWITLLSVLHTSRKARLEHAGEALITARIPVPAAAPQAVPAQHGASAMGKPSLGTATAPGTVPDTQHPHLPCRTGWFSSPGYPWVILAPSAYCAAHSICTAVAAISISLFLPMLTISAITGVKILDILGYLNQTGYGSHCSRKGPYPV